MYSRTVSRMICAALVLAFAVLSAISAVCADFPEQSASVYVYDSADVISSEIEDDINRRADALYAMCGAQIITVCVTTTGDTPIDKYTAELFNTWKIGSVQRNNGMLLIMATEDREYWILQGNGIKNDITDSDLQAVNNECLEQYFRNEKYGEGALAVFDRLLEKFQALYSIDISNWDGKYIDFSYPATDSESTAAQSQPSPGNSLMGFFKTILWIAA
ncbi:MAG: TPM domain-containing protein, partial [Lachnospiraceae bacterium]